MSPQADAARLHALDRANLFPPFTDLHHHAEHGGRIITRGEHVYIHDIDGRQMLDGMSGLWCCSLGYTQPRIVAAITAQLEKLPFYNSFFQCTHDVAIEMAAALVQVLPEGFRHVFFTNSGSEANDTNIRLVQRYFDLLGKPDKKIIISRRNAYHGSTIGGASLGGMNNSRSQFTVLPYVHHIAQPYWYREGGDLAPDEFGLRVARELERTIDELGEHRVAAFIAEPIQGAGGVIIPPDSYWPEVRRICGERDILVISDEVICGFGRTGSWFGCQTYGFQPDLITFAKAVTNGFQPLGGVAVGDRVATVLTAGGGEFAHGFTYSGHPVPCAAGLATLALLREGDYVSQVANTIGPYFAARWRELAAHPVVGEARCKGMLGALELVRDKSSREPLAPANGGAVFCRNAAIAGGLMVRQVENTMICAPPFVCSTAEIDLLAQRLTRALDLTAAEFGVR